MTPSKDAVKLLLLLQRNIFNIVHCQQFFLQHIFWFGKLENWLLSKKCFVIFAHFEAHKPNTGAAELLLLQKDF